ncbi:MAG: serine hydrolase [Cyclobacteriaceae bacterium]|nr:serine hydrolase [Cyclobacteriaceae bacterium]
MRLHATAVLLFLSIISRAQQSWPDSVMRRMSLQEKIGQLFVLRVNAGGPVNEIRQQLHQVRSYHPAGILFTGGGPRSLLNTAGQLRAASRFPLLMGIEGETGAGHVLDSIRPFPPAMLLAATADDSLQFRQGFLIGQQMKRLGLHFNIGINADVQVSPIGYIRYLGDQPTTVTHRGANLMLGMQKAGIVSVAFLPPPDQLITPTSPSSLVRLSEIDTSRLNALHGLVRLGLKGVWLDHLQLQLLGGKRPLPDPASQLVTARILSQSGFNGLSFADIPSVRRALRKARRGDAELVAFQLGHNAIIQPDHFAAAIKKISRLVKRNPAYAKQLDQAVLEILKLKWSIGLAGEQPPSPLNLGQELETAEIALHGLRVARSAVTVISNQEDLLPFKDLYRKRIVCMIAGPGNEQEFVRSLRKYVPIELITVGNADEFGAAAKKLGTPDLLLVAYFSSSATWVSETLPVLKDIRTPKVVVSFLDPMLLTRMGDFTAVVEAYTEGSRTQSLVAQTIFGGTGAGGDLPVKVEGLSSAKTEALGRLAYAVPEDVGMDSRMLEQIVPIAREAIDMGATPGCQILVARRGKVIWERSFGWMTYSNKRPVTEETIYDLASVTKVSATLQAIMHLYDSGAIDIYKKASVYLPELRDSNKKDFTLKDILTHQAGLWPFLPFWSQTMKDSVYKEGYYRSMPDPDFPFPVASGLFASAHMKDSLWHWIIQARVREKAGRTPYDYRYSDMGFYILQHLSEKLLNQRLDHYLEKSVYGPLGAYTTGYLPLERFDSILVAPTENDRNFRKSLLVGYVHDQGAAMHGGIAGHAGLFSNANDLAKLAQMWLQGGYYGGRQYYKPETLRAFTARQFENSRRGLGWDKPAAGETSTPTSFYSSQRTFGHTGFTGTCVWVDPEFDLVYIFLSNRVHPDMTNNRILNANIRTRVHDVIYRSIFEYDRKQGRN